MRPQTKSLIWHITDVLLAAFGLAGHVWLRRQYAELDREFANR